MDKIELFQNEKWKTVRFDIEHTNKMLLQISNCGRIRSSTLIAHERILKGSLINGYKFIQVKLYTPRTQKDEIKLRYLKNQISKINQKLTPLKNRLKNRKTKDKTYLELRIKIKELDVLLTGIKKNYRKEFSVVEKKRIVNRSILFHRLVAEYFCGRKTEEQNLVIHNDHNKLNNNAENLQWVTQQEATKHWQTSPRVIKQHKNKKGKRSATQKFKLNETRVMLIKKKINDGKSLGLLSKQFQVTETQLLRIKRGINWKDVKAAV